MASSGRPAPPKPWERAAAQGNAGPSPFAPSSPTNSTAAAIGAAASGEKPKDQTSPVRTVPVADGSEGRVMPLRPWERNNTGYGTGYGTMTSYNRPYNAVGGYSGYGGGYNGYGSSSYGGGMYGGGAMSGGMTGGLYGSNYGYGGTYNRYGGYGGGGYGGGGYGMSPVGGGPMGGYGGYGPGSPDNPNPNDPYGGPPRAPNFWQSMLSVLSGVMNFFGRLAILIDENTQAFHFFITALLQLCDRTGVLYGELARFVLRLLGFRSRTSKARRRAIVGAEEKPGLEAAPKGADGAWDNVWSNGEPQ